MASTGGPDRVPMCQHCGRPHHGECRKLLGRASYMDLRIITIESVRGDKYLLGLDQHQGHNEVVELEGVFVAARGQRPVSEPIQKPTSRAPSCAYSMRTREDSDAPDVILVDCGKKRIILYALDGHEVIVVGERSDYLDNVISATTACKLVGKGCEAYLAFILDT
ncbi:hypothetical protein SASPL_157235 [Salvia splendens]|uniref:Uncharacterized protein n=1 Tax=Salvia splendens TaxID=180675 RepID=A0A8X8VVA8_SALSN|nr:hypothetical protein SASPL_157235 [Salvia splendens]